MNNWASLVAQTVKNPPAMRETWVQSLAGKIPWWRAWQPTPVFLPGATAMSSHTCFQPPAPPSCCFSAPRLLLAEASSTEHRAGVKTSHLPEQTPVSKGQERVNTCPAPWALERTVLGCLLHSCHLWVRATCPRMPLEWLLFLWNRLPLDLTSSGSAGLGEVLRHQVRSSNSSQP